MLLPQVFLLFEGEVLQVCQGQVVSVLLQSLGHDIPVWSYYLPPA